MNIKTSVLCDRNFILCFNSLMCFFGVIYVSKSFEVHLCPREIQYIGVQYVIEGSLKFIYYSAFVGVCRLTDHKLPASLYSACDFELRKQPWLNGRCIALAVLHNWFSIICKS